MNHVLAGIVLYNADIDRLLLEIDSIYHQVEIIYLCDNGSKNIDIIEERVSKKSKVVLEKNTQNLGIGKASNQICSYAEQNGFQWVLLLDHDTICPDKLIYTYKKYMDNQSIGMMCPNVIDKEIVNNKWFSASNADTEYTERCIQSGTLLKLSSWRDCCGFDEWMFIDFVDFDFCTRLKLNGFKLLRCNKVIIDHQFGKRIMVKNAVVFERLYAKTHIKLFKYLTYRNAFNPKRVYYSTRNNIMYIKKYGNYIDQKVERKECLSRIIRRIIRSDKKWKAVRETWRGIWDGIKCSPTQYKPKAN